MVSILSHLVCHVRLSQLQEIRHARFMMIDKSCIEKVYELLNCVMQKCFFLKMFQL